jgi:hypothetical protein
MAEGMDVVMQEPRDAWLRARILAGWIQYKSLEPILCSC